MRLNFKLILYIIGLLLIFNGSAMILTAIVSLIFSDGVVNEIISSAAILMSLGLILMLTNKNNIRQINKRDGYLIVTVGWLTMILSGMIPYYLTNSIDSFSNIFFETMSGYTATGSTILDDVEALPKSIIFWRSMTHWLGGMGIIVLAIAILPLLGIGGMQLFSAEVPGSGISGDKIHPRISATAKRLWLIYFGLTILETIALSIAGMSFFDALNHSMSNIATGGFSTKNESLAYWNSIPSVQYIVIFFMILDFAGLTPFLTMLFFGLMFLGASSGSTSGGIKISRHSILIKNGFLEFKKALHPNAVLPLRYNHNVVKKEVVINILGFFMLYLILFIIGAGVLSIQGLDFISAIGGSAASIGNVGPALGSVGPAFTYTDLTPFAKIWCSFLMLVGRLELFTFLIIFSPYFWQKL